MFEVWSSRAHCSGIPWVGQGWHGVKLLCKCVFKLTVKCQKAGVIGREREKKSVSANKLTVNSPVTASKPTCMVCSKSEGGEISGRSLSRSFFRPPERNQTLIRITQLHKNDFKVNTVPRRTLPLTFFSPREDWDDLITRFSLLGHRRQRFRAVVGWQRVFARASAEDGAAHPDRRGWGFILRVSVITHRYRL